MADGLSEGSIEVHEDLAPPVLPEDVAAQHIIVLNVFKVCCLASCDPQQFVVALRARLEGSHGCSEVPECNATELESVCPRGDHTPGFVVGCVDIIRAVVLGVADHQDVLGHNQFFSVVGLVELQSSLPAVDCLEVADGRVAELLTQKPALLIPPQGIVFKNRVNGWVPSVRVKS